MENKIDKKALEALENSKNEVLKRVSEKLKAQIKEGQVVCGTHNSHSSGNSGSDPWVTTVNKGICTGEFCCSEGQVYDTSLNICVTGTTTSTETFVNNVLTKTQQGKYKTDVSLRDNYQGYK